MKNYSEDAMKANKEIKADISHWLFYEKKL